MIGARVNAVVRELHRWCSIRHGRTFHVRHSSVRGIAYRKMSKWTFTLWKYTMRFDRTVASGEVN